MYSTCSYDYITWIEQGVIMESATIHAEVSPKAKRGLQKAGKLRFRNSRALTRVLELIGEKLDDDISALEQKGDSLPEIKITVRAAKSD